MENLGQIPNTDKWFQEHCPVEKDWVQEKKLLKTTDAMQSTDLWLAKQ